MTHKVTTIAKHGAGGTAPTWYGPARDRRNARRPYEAAADAAAQRLDPGIIIHLTSAVSAKATACGLRDKSRPRTPYTLARNKGMIDRARIDGNLPQVTWCPACLAHFGWV